MESLHLKRKFNARPAPITRPPSRCGPSVRTKVRKIDPSPSKNTHRRPRWNDRFHMLPKDSNSIPPNIPNLPSANVNKSQNTTSKPLILRQRPKKPKPRPHKPATKNSNGIFKAAAPIDPVTGRRVWGKATNHSKINLKRKRKKWNKPQPRTEIKPITINPIQPSDETMMSTQSLKLIPLPYISPKVNQSFDSVTRSRTIPITPLKPITHSIVITPPKIESIAHSIVTTPPKIEYIQHSPVKSETKSIEIESCEDEKENSKTPSPQKPHPMEHAIKRAEMAMNSADLFLKAMEENLSNPIPATAMSIDSCPPLTRGNTLSPIQSEKIINKSDSKDSLESSETQSIGSEMEAFCDRVTNMILQSETTFLPM